MLVEKLATEQPDRTSTQKGPPTKVAFDHDDTPTAAAVASDDATDFTEERAKRVATNGKILLTFVNRIRLDFATTWVYHVRRLGMTNWLVGATDQTSLRSLVASGASRVCSPA